MNITELREKSTRLSNQARDLLDTITDENRSDKEAEFERMMDDADKAANQADRLEAAEKRDRALEQIATDVPETRSTTSTSKEERDAFAEYVRGDLSARELRAMGTNPDENGGFVVPQTWAANVLRILQETGPMLNGSVVTVLETATGNTINQPIVDDSVKGFIVGENTEIAKSEVTFANANIGAFKYTSGIVPVSNELLQDAYIDLGSLIPSLLFDRIARAANEHLTVGTGTNQPHGLVTAAQVGVQGTAADGFTADEMISLFYSLRSDYRSRAKWMLSDVAIKSVRLMKDGNDQYIWQPGFSAGDPATVLGTAAVINPDMPAFETGAKPILIGDFKAYTTRTVRGSTVRRLEERYAEFDQTAFVGLSRIDGELINRNAVKALKLA